jgi:hypothetical protein
MAKQKNKKNKKGNNFLDTYRSVRKPMPPSTRVISPKKKYDRKDKSWEDEI